ncbi:MAG TPA: methyltransferase domain-containing protein [Ktedonobacterales bacterium]
MPLPVVLSYIQAEELLRAHREGQASARVSPDLGLSKVEVRLTGEGVRFPSGESLSWAGIARIGEARNVCFALEGDAAREIRTFSDTTGWVRALMPTNGAPTMLVAGLPMHRIKDTDPYADTLKKVKTLAPIAGRVLDTATGLGYTAIEAAKTAQEVVSIELDPAGIEIARQNPWSQPLFERANIRIEIGDAAELIPRMESETFSCILHDPPMITLAGDLYSAAFYREVHRILRRGGRMFHYIGDPQSPSGKRTTAGVIRRLQDVGFTRVVRRPEAFGVVAYK